jgi:hypothetical protein
VEKVLVDGGKFGRKLFVQEFEDPVVSTHPLSLDRRHLGRRGNTRALRVALAEHGPDPVPAYPATGAGTRRLGHRRDRGRPVVHRRADIVGCHGPADAREHARTFLSFGVSMVRLT